MAKEACLYKKIKYPSHNKIKMIGLFSRGCGVVVMERVWGVFRVLW